MTKLQKKKKKKKKKKKVYTNDYLHRKAAATATGQTTTARRKKRREAVVYNDHFNCSTHCRFHMSDAWHPIKAWYIATETSGQRQRQTERERERETERERERSWNQYAHSRSALKDEGPSRLKSEELRTTHITLGNKYSEKNKTTHISTYNYSIKIILFFSGY